MLVTITTYVVALALLSLHPAAIPIRSAKPPLNKHELVLLANELSPKECRVLAGALQRESFALKSTPTGNDLPMVPCVELLQSWNHGDGQKSSWTHVTHRLYQIGRKDLSKELAGAILAEKRHRLEKYFLDNPFKKHIRHGGILEEDQQQINFDNRVKRDLENGENDTTASQAHSNELRSYLGAINHEDPDFFPRAKQYTKPVSKKLILAVVIPMLVVPGIVLVMVCVGIVLSCRKTDRQTSRQAVCLDGNGDGQVGEFEMTVRQNGRPRIDRHVLPQMTGRPNNVMAQNVGDRVREFLPPIDRTRRKHRCRGCPTLISNFMGVDTVEPAVETLPPIYPNGLSDRTRSINSHRVISSMVRVHWIDQSEDHPFSSGLPARCVRKSSEEKEVQDILRRNLKRERRKAIEREKYSRMVPTSSSEDGEMDCDDEEC
ncbi:uncharacterized protein [Ptychodera flava]|uniref:uncharacterized protein n=1 Tax=Ptychodera flava TaxID=63121 RepID=UPI00396A948F